MKYFVKHLLSDSVDNMTFLCFGGVGERDFCSFSVSNLRFSMKYNVLTQQVLLCVMESILILLILKRWWNV